MGPILDFLASFLIAFLPDSAGSGRAADRRLIARDEVRCGIRAVDGRVLNMGREWSTGVCEISVGHLRFRPSTGIVGNREIDVVGLRLVEGRPDETILVSWAESTDLIISTTTGELYWVIPQHIADEVIARLLPLTV